MGLAGGKAQDQLTIKQLASLGQYFYYAIATVQSSDATKVLTVRVNNNVVKTMPTSMGKDSSPTANGIYIVGSRFKHIVMDSSTYGVPVNSPNGYRTEVDFAHLIPTGTVTACPYKGTTSGYWSVRAGGTIHPDLAWSYDFPTRQLLPIAGLIAFYNEKVDIILDGQRLERPQTHFFSR